MLLSKAGNAVTRILKLRLPRLDSGIYMQVQPRWLRFLSYRHITIQRISTMSSLTEGAVLLGVLWILWRMLRPYVVKSSLENVPGPLSAPFLQGESWPMSPKYPALKRAQDTSQLSSIGMGGTTTTQ